jgi:hypothetical protein
MCNEEILMGASKCKHCGEFLSPAARRAAGLQPLRSIHQANDVVIPAIDVPTGQGVLCLLLCPPLGIIALIFAAQADAKLRAGDITGAKVAAVTSRNVSMLGSLVGLFVWVFIALWLNK